MVVVLTDSAWCPTVLDLMLILKDRSLSGGALKGGASRPDEALAGGGPAIFHFVAAGLSGARIGIGGEHKVLAVLPEGANDRLFPVGPVSVPENELPSCASIFIFQSWPVPWVSDGLLDAG